MAKEKMEEDIKNLLKRFYYNNRLVSQQKENLNSGTAHSRISKSEILTELIKEGVVNHKARNKPYTHMISSEYAESVINLVSNSYVDKKLKQLIDIFVQKFSK